MEFQDAWGLECVRAESWFRAGDLSFSQDADQPFMCFLSNVKQPKAQDGTYSSSDQDLSRFRLWFKLERNICSRQPERCLPILMAGKAQELWKQLSHIRAHVTEAEAPFFAPRRKVEEIFGVTGDPESLDDSYIVELLGNSQQGDHSNGLKERLDKIELYPDYLLISRRSIYRVGEPLQTSINQGITDCQIFNTLPEKLASLIIVTTPSGYIFSILLGVGEFKPAIIQYWKLGSAGHWNIVKHQSHEQFVAVNKKEGTCKFFSFRDPLHFKLVNNISIDNTQFLDCLFFPNASQSHFLLFVPSVRYHRLVFFCIEWDTVAPETKEVYQLTYLKGHLIDCCVPVGNNRALVFNGDEISLVSAHQIMSGETNFNQFELKLLNGICSFFEAPQLLQKLKVTHGDPFTNFHYCTLLATFSGNIAICVMDEHDRIEFYSLTRFKGLKNVCPVNLQKSTDKEYEVVVISFGRTLELTIDISGIQPLLGDSLIPLLDGIRFKHTLDSSTEDNTKLLVLSPRKSASRFVSELWLTSNMAISHLQTFAPVRKLHEICELRQFRLFNKIKVFNCSTLKNELKEALFQEMKRHDSQMYLLIATDSISISKAFLLNLCLPEVTMVELDDLLQDDTGDTIEIFFSAKGSLVQITRDIVYVDPLSLSPDGQRGKYSPGWNLQGAIHCDNKVIIWNCKEYKFSFINDIDDLGKTGHFESCSFFENKMKFGGYKRVDFCLAQVDNTIFLYMATDRELSRYSLDICYSQNDASDTSELLSYGCTGSPLPLRNHLCFIKNESQLFNADHRGLHTAEIDLKYSTKDFQIRPFDEDSCLVFSPQEITILPMSATNGQSSGIYELKLPQRSKINPILDVNVDSKNKRIFVLYSDGIAIFDLSYFTWNSSNYLLRSTKTWNKKFLFITKINRMLVVNLRAREWDCIKLADGKTLSLDPSALQNPDNLKLVNVVEISAGNDFVQLLLHFGTLIKLVQLVPKRGRILVQELSQYEFTTPLFEHIEISQDGSFLVFLSSSSSSSKSPSDCFMQMTVDQQDQLKVVCNLNFPQPINLLNFKLCGKDLIIISKSYDRVFLMKDFQRLASQKHLQAISLKMPLASMIQKVCSLDNDSFVVAVSCEGRSDHITELLFYHRNDVVVSHENTQDLLNGDLLYEATVLDDAQRQEESEVYRLREDDDSEANFDDDEDMLSISAARADDDWDTNYRDFLNRMANGRLGRGEEWDFDDFDGEYEVGEEDEVAQESEGDEDMLDTDEMDEMDEFDAFERPVNSSFPLDPDPEEPDDNEPTSCQLASADLVRPVSTSRRRKPYQVVSLDKAIKDVKYDKAAKALYVLTLDSSVIVLGQTSKEVAMQSVIQEELSDPAPVSSVPRTTGSGVFPLDAEGHSEELPWL